MNIGLHIYAIAKPYINARTAEKIPRTYDQRSLKFDKVKIKRIERNTDKLQEMYDLGVSDCQKLLPNIKSVLSGEVEVYGKKRIQKNSQKGK